MNCTLQGVATDVYKILSEGLGIDPEGEFEIERAHCFLTPRPDADRPPRIVLIKFLHMSAREKVLQVAKEIGMIEWDGCRISFFPDMSRELTRRRRDFTVLQRMLRSINFMSIHIGISSHSILFIIYEQTKRGNDPNK